MSKLSDFIVDHIESLLDPYDLSQCPLKALPKASLTPDELQQFWRYHGHFPQEFTQALINQLPSHLTFVSYDHLKNQLTVSGAH